MRASIIASVGLAVVSAASVFLHAAPAKAQDPGRPWCLEESSRNGNLRNCGFVSFQQCLASRSTPSGGNCYRNPAILRPTPTSRIRACAKTVTDRRRYR